MRFTLIAIITILALGSAALAQQGKGANKNKQVDRVERTAQQTQNRTKQERDKIRDSRDRQDDDSSNDDYSDDDSSDRDSRDDDSNDKRSDDDSERRTDNQSSNARSQEMLERRDERKQIKEEYRADREPGQERASGSEDNPDDTAARDNAKKPWWKFWGED